MASAVRRTVRAAVMPAPGEPVEVREFPMPELAPGAALLRNRFSEVCGTDVHLQQGRLAETPFPLIPGHANVGVLERIRGQVRDVNGRRLAEGDRVSFLDVFGTCGACWYCLVARASTRCPSRRVYGITCGAGEGLFGGWSEYIHLVPGVKIVPLGEGLSAETVIGGGCGLPTALHAVERADIRLADSVLVQGAGPVGLSATALASLRGPRLIIAIGAPRLRLAAAGRMGADLCLDVESTSVAERRAAVLEATGGRGVDRAIEASGNPAAVAEGLDLVRDAGTYAVVGQYTDHGPVQLNPHTQINRKHVTIHGVWGIDYSHFHRGIELQQRYNERFEWERLITHRFGLAEANEALAAVREGRAIKAVIDPWKTS